MTHKDEDNFDDFKKRSSDPVSRSMERVKERDSWPNVPFFTKKPGKVTPEMRDRWIATRNEESQPDVKPLPGGDWVKTASASTTDTAKPKDEWFRKAERRADIKPLPERDKSRDRDR